MSIKIGKSKIIEIHIVNSPKRTLSPAPLPPRNISFDPPFVVADISSLDDDGPFLPPSFRAFVSATFCLATRVNTPSLADAAVGVAVAIAIVEEDIFDKNSLRDETEKASADNIAAVAVIAANNNFMVLLKQPTCGGDVYLCCDVCAVQ